MAIANFFITMFTWLAVMNLSYVWYAIIPLLGVSIMTFVGWIDFHLIKRHEIAHQNTVSDLKEQVDRIEKKLEVLLDEKY